MSTILSKKIRWNDTAYRLAIKELRRFYRGYSGSDGYDLRVSDLSQSLSKYQRRKVREQFAYIDHIQSGIPKRVYRAKTKNHIDTILEAQGYRNIPKNLKVAFVPNISETKTKVRYVKPRKITAYDKKKKKKVVLIELAPVETVTFGVTRRYVNINQDFLTESLHDAVMESMRLARANFYAIQAGIHEVQEQEYKIRQDDTPEEIADKLKKLQLKYANEDQNNYWRNWLGGLVAYYYPDQTSFQDYIVKQSLKRAGNKRKRKSEREKFRRKQATEIRKKKLQKRIDTAIKKAIEKQRKKDKAEIRRLKKQLKRK